MDQIDVQTDRHPGIEVFDLAEGTHTLRGELGFGLFLILTGVAIGYGSAWAALTDPTVTWSGRGFCALLGLFAAMVVAWGISICRRTRLEQGRLEITADELLLVFPTLFGETLRLNRDDVLHVAVDDTRRKRFPIVDDPDWSTDQLDRHVIGHLWTKTLGGALPLVSHRTKVPDCAIVFAGSRVLPMRPGVRANPSPSRRPRRDRTEAGLLLASGDTVRLREALAGWPTDTTVERAVLEAADRPAQLELGGHAAPGRAPARSSPVQPAALAPRTVSHAQAKRRIVLLIAVITVGSAGWACLWSLVVLAAVHGSIPPLFGAFATVMIGVLVAVLLPRLRAGQEPGERTTRETQPDLWRVIDEESERLGLPLPDELRLTLQPSVTLTHGRSRVTLSLGLPSLALMTEPQLRVAMSAALNGRRHNAARFVHLAWRARHPVERVLTLHSASTEVSAGHRITQRVFEPLSLGLARAADALRDASVQDADARALRRWPSTLLDETTERLAQAFYAWDAYWQAAVVPALRETEVPSLAHGFATACERPPGDAWSCRLISNLDFVEDRMLT